MEGIPHFKQGRVHRANALPYVLAVIFFCAWIPLAAPAQTTQPAADTSGLENGDIAAAYQYAGRTVERVEVQGNSQISTATILNLIRTHVGDKFDPDTVRDDYQRIYSQLKVFQNVEARYQPTKTGIIVIFVVTEQKIVTKIQYVGNTHIATKDLEGVVDLRPGQAIDRFHIGQAEHAIEKFYMDKNYPSAHVSDNVSGDGQLVLTVVEGPLVRIRKIDFVGNNSFTNATLRSKIKSDYWKFIFVPGTFDPDQLDEDVASLRQYYIDMGFFDIRVGRKISRSADMTDVQITFLLDEGVRYTVGRVEFKGLSAITEGTLRKNLVLLEGQPYQKDLQESDIRSMVKAYSGLGGFVYDQEPGIRPDPDYLSITCTPEFHDQPGKVDLVYEVHEGKQFRVGEIRIKGNEKIQDRVILRELHIVPGQEYDSNEVLDAVDRLEGTQYFEPRSVSITPVPVPNGDPNSRDLVVDVGETSTASFNVGVGINSNGGLSGNIGFQQRNFDITNWPTSWDSFFSDRPFTGAGQSFAINLSPGTEGTDASISWTDPYILDQPYSLTTAAYLEDRIRENYDDNRLGTSITLGHQFNYVYSAGVTFRVEDVDIRSISDPLNRPAIINDGGGYHWLTSIALNARRDTTNHGPVPFRGSTTSIGIEQEGAMGGQINFTRISAAYSNYISLYNDLLNRHTVLNTHIEFADDLQQAPFYERLYGGGIGSIRGFQYRGVGPRAGPENDPIGGDFAITGGAELTFPIAEDFLRGVLFFDAGDVEPNMHFGTIRTAVGFGFRINAQIFGPVPIALDFGFPITENRLDRESVLSFSIGFNH